jgi:uncharacterized integral membrane protein
MRKKTSDKDKEWTVFLSVTLLLLILAIFNMGNSMLKAAYTCKRGGLRLPAPRPHAPQVMSRA